MTAAGLVVSLVAGSASLAWAYAAAGADGGARGLSLLGVIWLTAEWRRWRWVRGLGLFVYVGFAAYGLWIGLPASRMVIGVLGALLAWDLGDFRERLRRASPTDDRRGLELRHLGRLVIVAAAGLLLAGLTAVLRVRLTFEVVTLLVVLTALGLAQLVRWLGQRGG
jgi:hypothetical protein